MKMPDHVHTCSSILILSALLLPVLQTVTAQKVSDTHGACACVPKWMQCELGNESMCVESGESL